MLPASEIPVRRCWDTRCVNFFFFLIKLWVNVCFGDCCLVIESHVLVVLLVWLEKWPTNGRLCTSLSRSPDSRCSNGKIRNETWLLFKVCTCPLFSHCLLSSLAKMYPSAWRMCERAIWRQESFSALHYWFICNLKYMVHLSCSRTDQQSLWILFFFFFFLRLWLLEWMLELNIDHWLVFIGPRRKMLVRATPWVYITVLLSLLKLLLHAILWVGWRALVGFLCSLAFTRWFVLYGCCNRFWVGFVGVCEALCDSDFLHLAVSSLCLVHVGRQAFGLSALCCLWDGGASCLCSRVVLWDRMLDIQTSRWWNWAYERFLLNGSFPEQSWVSSCILM